MTVNAVPGRLVTGRGKAADPHLEMMGMVVSPLAGMGGTPRDSETNFFLLFLLIFLRYTIASRDAVDVGTLRTQGYSCQMPNKYVYHSMGSRGLPLIETLTTITLRFSHLLLIIPI